MAPGWRRIIAFLVATVALSGCGSSGAGGGSTSTVGSRLRFAVPVGTVLRYTSTTTIDGRLEVESLEPPAGTAIDPADLDSLKETVLENLAPDDQRTFHGTVRQTLESKVVSRDPDGTTHVVSTSRGRGNGLGVLGQISAGTTVLYRPDGRLTVEDATIKGLTPALRDTLVAAMKKTGEQDTSAVVYRMPLQPGAHVDSSVDLEQRFPVPIGGQTLGPLHLRGPVTTTYDGRHGDAHVFRVHGTLKSNSLALDVSRGDIGALSLSLADSTLDGAVEAGADGRMLRTESKMAMTMRVAAELPTGDGTSATVTFVLPLRLDIVIQPVA